MVGSDLLRYRSEQLFAVTDAETNGLNLRHSLPWQISYTLATQKNIVKQVTRYIYWKDFQMTEDAARVTRFDMNVYKERAEDADKVLKDCEEVWFDPSIRFSGHNILGYDAYIIDSWRQRLGRKSDWSFLNGCIDTNLLMKAIQKGWQPDRENLLQWQYRVLNYREKGLKSSLGFSCRYFQIQYDEFRAHDANYDVSVNAELLSKQIWAIEI